jgi:hypothetical protein
VRLPGDNTLRVLGFLGAGISVIGFGLEWRWEVAALLVYAAGALLLTGAASVHLLRPRRPPVPPGDALLDRALTWRARLQLRKFRGDPPCSHREDSHA